MEPSHARPQFTTLDRAGGDVIPQAVHGQPGVAEGAPPQIRLAE
jgi:hypothetical protein